MSPLGITLSDKCLEIHFVTSGGGGQAALNTRQSIFVIRQSLREQRISEVFGWLANMRSGSAQASIRLRRHNNGYA